MEIKLWKLSACIKRKFYCFEDFTKPLAFFVWVKTLTKESKGIKIPCLKFLYIQEHSQFTVQQGNREGISLTALYHFQSLHRRLDISWAITADSSPQPGSNRDPLLSERQSLTTKLHALKYIRETHQYI